MVDGTLPTPEHAAQEEWRAIADRPGYEVSSLGRVRSIPRLVWVNDASYAEGGWWRHYRKARVLETYPGSGGYPYLSLGGGYPNKAVHRLVAAAFLGPQPTSEHEVAHENGNRQDSRACNLRWSTRSENQQDRRAHGTYFMRCHPGERHHKAKLTEASVVEIREAYTGRYGEIASLAARYGVGHSCIDRIVKGRGWTHINAPPPS